ncbi:MAG: alpha/beta hydrolase [Gemmatimonadales bacterium]
MVQRVLMLIGAVLAALVSSQCRHSSWHDHLSLEGTIEQSGGPSLFYRVVGSGPDTAIVLHGGSLSQQYLLEPLWEAAPNHTLIFFDFRNRGRSAAVADSTELTFDADLADLDLVRSHFRLDRPALIGHHYGAAVAALYAARHPEHASRVLAVSPFPVIYSWFYEFTAIQGDSAKYRDLLAEVGRNQTTDSIHAYCERAWPAYFSPIHPDLGTPYPALARTMCDEPAERLLDSRSVTTSVQRSLGMWVFRPELNHLGVPLLVIEGGGEPLIDEAATRWAQHAPDGRILLLRRPYLFPWVTDPGAFARGVRAFLSGDWPDGSVAPPPWIPPDQVAAGAAR